MPIKVDLYCAVVILGRPCTVTLPSRGSGDAAMNSKTVCNGKTIVILCEGGGNAWQPDWMCSSACVILIITQAWLLWLPLGEIHSIIFCDMLRACSSVTLTLFNYLNIRISSTFDQKIDVKVVRHLAKFWSENVTCRCYNLFCTKYLLYQELLL